MSSEKPNFSRRNPDPKIPGQSQPVSAEDLGARVTPDPEGTIFSKSPAEETKIIPPTPPPPNPSPPPPNPEASAPPPNPVSSPSPTTPPSFSATPGTGSEPRPMAFAPQVDEKPTTFSDDEEEEKGTSAALLIAIAAFLLSVLGVLIATGLVPLGPSSDLIGQDRLSDNSVGEPQLQDQAVTLDKINTDILGQLRGERGPAGKEGPAGPAGPAGSGLSEIQVRTKEVSGTSTSTRASALVTCDSGEVLLSGGASLSGADGKVVIVASNPSSDNNAWFSESARIDPENRDPWTLTVYALCGKKSDQSQKTEGGGN